MKVVQGNGYFQPREALWREPIYRNVFGLLEQFGDAEIASLIAPRALIIEACRHPESAGPPTPGQGRGGGAAPGVLETPSFAAVQGEFDRARHLTEALKPAPILKLVGSGSGLPGSDSALTELLQALGITRKLVPPAAPPVTLRGFVGNPMRGTADVEFKLVQREPVRLQLFDVAGRQIAERDARWMTPGDHVVCLNEHGALPSGVYFVRLSTPGQVLHARGVVIN